MAHKYRCDYLPTAEARDFLRGVLAKKAAHVGVIGDLSGYRSDTSMLHRAAITPIFFSNHVRGFHAGRRRVGGVAKFSKRRGNFEFYEPRASRLGGGCRPLYAPGAYGV